MGLAALILGVISIAIIFLMPLAMTFAYICGIVAIVLGIVDYMPVIKEKEIKGVVNIVKSIINTALGKDNKEKRLTSIGIILGVASLPLAVIMGNIYAEAAINAIDEAFADAFSGW